MAQTQRRTEMEGSPRWIEKENIRMRENDKGDFKNTEDQATNNTCSDIKALFIRSVRL